MRRVGAAMPCVGDVIELPTARLMSWQPSRLHDFMFKLLILIPISTLKISSREPTDRVRASAHAGSWV
jgi:hypothetical protein